MKKTAAFSICILLSVFLALTQKAPAVTYTLTPTLTDSEVGPSWVDNINGSSSRVGTTNAGGYGRNVVYVFGYPKVAFGDTISGANFSAYLNGTRTPFSFNGDLYSLGVSTNSATSTTDYFNGAYGTDSHATGLQQGYLSTSSAVGTNAASSTGNAAIAADLEAYRAAGVTPGSYYFLRASPDFTGSPTNSVQGYNMSMTGDVPAHWPALTVTTSHPPQLGRVLIEYWTGVTGNYVSQLTTTANYPNKPNAREYPTVLEIPQNMDANSGDRMRCYFYPPISGTYIFAIASDDNSILRFSMDGNPADAVQVAGVTSPTGYHSWGAAGSYQQYSVSLTAGSKYYIETVHKQSTGNSNCSLGWNPPSGVAGSGSINLMPATYCEPFDASAGYSGGAIASSLTQSRPRLMLSAAAIVRLKAAIAVSGSTSATWWAAIQTQANTMGAAGSVATITPSGTSFIAAARSLQDRAYYLGLDYLLNSNTTVQTNCLNQIYAELQNAANWGSGGPGPNHLTWGPWATWQFLDLPEISHAYAIAYDWCYNGWTPTQKTFILNTIVSNALNPAITAYGPPTANFLNGVGNWTINCDSGLIVSSLSILGDETSSPKAPTVLDDLMPALYSSPAMAEWGPDGGWPESEGYWNFSTRYLSTLFSSLETTSATCFNFDQLDGMSSMGSFELYEIGPLNLNFDFSDEGGPNFWEDTQGASQAMEYFSLKYNQPVYAWRQQQDALPYPTDLIWYDPRGGSSSSTPWSLNIPPSTYFGNAGVIILRSAWNDTNALFAGMKAGYNSGVTPYGSGHEDLELGSFVFDALGVRWAWDMGEDNYALPNYFKTTWSPTSVNRWWYYRCRAEGNNTLVINPANNVDQSLTGTAAITNFVTTATTQQAIIDMSSAYPALTSAKRGLRFINGVAQLQDEISASTGVDFNWFMHTQAAVVLSNGNKTATLTPTSGSSRLQMTIQSSSSSAVFTSTTSAKPLPTSPDYATFASDGENQNAGISTLRIEVPASTSLTVTVNMCPYIQGNTPPAPIGQAALSAW